MAEPNGQYQKLPPGWDCRFDQATGNCYFINYFTKAMQLEDPRTRYKQLQNERCSTESIPMQPLHGSPYHVYPRSNSPAMRHAFQAATNPSLNNMSSSPLLSSRGNLEASPLPFPRTTLGMPTQRAINLSRRSTIQETSFTNQIDTEAVVAKIQGMFPTASETHIRFLLKKYYNREAVVISALQVEKYPVTMPHHMEMTPPALRHLFHSNSAFHMTPPMRRLDIGANSRVISLANSRTASPIPGIGRFGSVISMHSGGGGGGGVGSSNGGIHVRGTGVDGTLGGYSLPTAAFTDSPRFGEQWRSSPKPHSSPKMKLRYMKNIFPKADEMLLLDILASVDDNVQKASEKLIKLGYAKREFVPSKTPTNQARRTSASSAPPKKPGDERIIPLRPKEYTPEEKADMQTRLESKYPQIAQRIILMALESVNYSEDRAEQILHIVQQEDETLAKKHAILLQAPADAQCLVPPPDNEQLTTIESIIEIANTTNSTENVTKLDEKDGGNDAPSNIKTTTTIATLTTSSSTSSAASTSTSTASASASVSSTAIDNNGKIKAQTKKSSLGKTHKKSQNSCLSSSSATSPKSASTLPISSSLSSSLSFKFQTKKSTHSLSQYANFRSGTSSISATIMEKLKFSRPREKTTSPLKQALRESPDDDVDNLKQQQEHEFKSLIGSITTKGHNTALAKGPDEKLLLADYMTWNGANPNITVGQKQLAHGPNSELLSERTYSPMGHNTELYKGPKSGLAKGSIYAKFSKNTNTKSPNIKCN